MKRILILGASSNEVEIIKCAKQLKIFTICTDNHKNFGEAPAKRVADKYWNISWTDYSELAKKCIEEKVDGIFAGFSEARVLAATKLSKMLNKPFYTTGSNLSVIQDKEAFKKACIDARIRIPKTFKEHESIVFPVIVKPSDNGGSRGISICYNREELRTGILKAKNASNAKKITIEEYLSGDEIMVYFNVYEGEPVFSLMCDRIQKRFRKDITQIPVGYYFKSKHLNTFIVHNLSKYKDLIKRLSIQNGLIAFQCFVCGKDVIPYDPTYRLDGTIAYHFSETLNDVSSMNNMLFYSLGDNAYQLERKNNENYNLSKICFELPINLTSGQITKISGVDEVRRMPEVVHVYQGRYIGEIMEKYADFSQMSFRILLVTSNVQEMINALYKIKSLIKIEDENSNDMILDNGRFDCMFSD